MQEVKEMGIKIEWEKAVGHSGEEGNEAAHMLAFEAAKRAKREMDKKKE